MALQTIVQAYDGYFGVGLQATIGTGVVATKYQRITEANITYKEPSRAVTQSIAKKRNFLEVVRGPIEVSGSVSGPLTADELFGGIGWGLLLGASNTVSGAGTTGYTHVFNEGGALPNVGVTAEIYKGGSAMMFDLIGMFLNKLTLNFGAQEPVTFTSDWIGVTQAVGGDVGTPTYNDDPQFEGWMVKLEYGTSIGASLTEIPLVQSATWSYDNKLEGLRGIGSRYVVGRKLGRPEITIDLTKILQNDATLYGYFTANTQNALKLTLTHDSLAGSVSGVYSIVINMPKVVWLGEGPGLSGSDSIEEPYKLQAIEETVTHNYAVQVTILNSESGAYTVTA